MAEALDGELVVVDRNRNTGIRFIGEAAPKENESRARSFSRLVALHHKDFRVLRIYVVPSHDHVAPLARCNRALGDSYGVLRGDREETGDELGLERHEFRLADEIR